MIIAVPVLEEGKLVKIITGNVSLQRISDLIKEIKFKENGFATLIDDSGMIIAHGKRPELNGKLNISTKKLDPELQVENTGVDDHYKQLFEDAKSGSKTSGLYTDLDGIRNIDQIAVGSQELVKSIQSIDCESKTNAAETLNVSAVSEEQLASMEEIASASQVSHPI
ncbi:hypothetical protein [Pelosinus fermentans]|uniref:Cache domain containing protein n=1 Tax=Pelosinus fermentans JBW45 TaxID=1192197 RepID=I9DJX4_9FIRM|nr:hypothetical protein [Pelosinus fermentans]AJQ29843.1 Cache domain containing protein [Pelosinus fermentans JBW45]